jgi:hypothetical protein
VWLVIEGKGLSVRDEQRLCLRGGKGLSHSEGRVLSVKKPNGLSAEGTGWRTERGMGVSKGWEQVVSDRRPLALMCRSRISVCLPVKI